MSAWHVEADNLLSRLPWHANPCLDDMGGEMKPVVEVTIPIKIVSEANTTGAWRTKARRVKEQKRVVTLVMSQFDVRLVKLPAVVRFTRLSFGELDTDNLASSCKAARDSVAAWLGIDDGDVTRVMYQYAQGMAPRKTYALKVEVFGGCRLRETVEPASEGGNT